MASLQKYLAHHQTMAISNELSSDVAVAILVNKFSAGTPGAEGPSSFEVHSTLQKMSEETRADCLSKQPLPGTKKS